MNARIEIIEKALTELSNLVYLLKNKPTEHVEAVWRDQVVLELEEICARAREVDSIIFSRKCDALKHNLMKLPSDIRNFVEGK